MGETILIVRRQIRHDGTTYEPGVEFPQDRATPGQIDQLLASGALAPFAPQEPKPAPEPVRPSVLAVANEVVKPTGTQPVGDGETKNHPRPVKAKAKAKATRRT
uniref:Uncharacterized protein n=1 Tax=viral metagenome TaxID=1070528 RepID=A0A6M3J2A6_9ZZZZ